MKKIILFILISFTLYAAGDYLIGISPNLENYNTISQHQIANNDEIRADVINKKFEVLRLKLEDIELTQNIGNLNCEDISGYSSECENNGCQTVNINRFHKCKSACTNGLDYRYSYEVTSLKNET